jgi:hypothetical protein
LFIHARTPAGARFPAVQSQIGILL